MPRKSSKASGKKQKKSRIPFPYLWISAAIFLMLFFAAFFLRSNEMCANAESCITDLSGDYAEQEQQGEYHGKVVPVPEYRVQDIFTPVLGDSTGNNKRIEVDLENQKLYAFEENNLIYEFPISSGKWGKTPTGDFRIWVKIRYTRMSGGNRALGTYYNLPNVPYTMFFYNDDIPKSRGFGIHGAYWHNNFGTPMSHGCINMKTEEVEKIYAWASPESVAHTTYATDEDPGTPIRIYGVAANY